MVCTCICGFCARSEQGLVVWLSEAEQTLHLAGFTSSEMIIKRCISVRWLRVLPPTAASRIASRLVGPSSRPVTSVFFRPFSAAAAAMGAGGSRAEGGRRAKLTFRRSRKAAEEVASSSAQQAASEPVLTQQGQVEVQGNGGDEQQEKKTEDAPAAQPAEQGGAGAGGDDLYVQAVVAYASEFGENE